MGVYSPWFHREGLPGSDTAQLNRKTNEKEMKINPDGQKPLAQRIARLSLWKLDGAGKMSRHGPPDLGVT